MDRPLEKTNLSRNPFRNRHYGCLPLRDDKAFPSVALVMPVGGSDLPLVKADVEALFNVTAYPDWRIVFIDDASSGGILDYLAKVPDSLLLTNKVRQSFSANCNRGMRSVNCDYYVLFNSDVLVKDPLWLHKMVAVAENDERVGIVGGGINSCGSFWWIDNRGVASPQHFFHRKFFRRAPMRVQCVGGFNYLIKLKLLDELGGLDEGFHPVYGEETDLSIRASLLGYHIYDTLIDVYHVNESGFRETLGKSRIGATLGASARRLALKWAAALPHNPLPSYSDAIAYLDHLAQNGRAILDNAPALPPTTMPDGTPHPLYAAFPACYYKRRHSPGEAVSMILSQLGRVEKQRLTLKHL